MALQQITEELNDYIRSILIDSTTENISRGDINVDRIKWKTVNTIVYEHYVIIRLLLQTG